MQHHPQPHPPHPHFMNSPQGCCGKHAAVPTFRIREFRIYPSLMEVLVVSLENCVEILAGLDSVDAERRLEEEESCEQQ